MNTVNPISKPIGYNVPSSTPAVEPSRDGKQEYFKKETEKEVVVPSKDSGKSKTAKMFSTDTMGKNKTIVPRAKKVEEQVSTEQFQNSKLDDSDPLKTKEGVEAFAHVLEEYAKHVHNVGLRFAVHEDTGRTVVRIIDEETNEVVREVPPEELLDVAAKMEQMMGMLLDENA